MARSHRVQALLDDEQFRELEAVAKAEGKTISELVRHAVDVTYLEDFRQRRRLEAVERMAALDAPVCDWEQMKAEIIRGALGETIDLP